MTMTAGTQLRRALSVGSIGFGVLAVAAPSSFLALYDLDDTPQIRVIARLWGTRNLSAAVLTLLATGDQARRHDVALAAMGLADSVIIALSSGASTRARATGALTTAAFGAGWTYTASHD